MSTNVIFDENGIWDWKIVVDTPLTFYVNLNLNEKYKESEVTQVTTVGVFQLERSNAQPQEFVDSQTEFGKTSSPRLMSLSDLHARCNVSVIECEKYE